MKYEIGHIAFVVKDLDAAMAFMASLGAELTEKKTFGNQCNVMEGKIEPWQVTYCKGMLGNMGLEIFMPDGEGTPYGKFMAKTGGGIHHISFDHLGEDMESAKDALEAKGAKVFSSAAADSPQGPRAYYMTVEPMSGTVMEVKKA